MSAKIPAASSRARQALAQYIAPPPISLAKMLVQEHHSSLLYPSEYNPYFKTNARLFPALEFLVQLLQHLPDPRVHRVRPYGLYSSRSRGTGARKPWLLRLAPPGLAAAACTTVSPAFAAGPAAERRADSLLHGVAFRMGATAGQGL